MKISKIFLGTALGFVLSSTFLPYVKADNASEIERNTVKSESNNEDKIVHSNVVMIDVARRKLDKTKIKQVIKNINAQKFQFVQLHLADNDNFAVKTNILHNKEANNTLSINDLNDIVRYANSKGIQVIADLDVPAHAKGIITDLENADSSWLNKGVAMDNETLDYTNPETLNFVKQLYAEILPAFKSQTNPYVVIGADEVAGNQANANSFAQFINGLNKYCNYKGVKTIVWNDCLNKQVLNQLNTNITVFYWNNESDCGTDTKDILRHGNPIKNAFHENSYYNTIDLDNAQLKNEKSQRLAEEKNTKVLALWGSDSSQEQEISNKQIIDYIKQVQNKIK